METKHENVQIINQLTSVHDAFQEAVLQGGLKEDETFGDSNATITFRLPKMVKDHTENLCLRQGTTLSRFLRECCIGLVKDYMR